MLFEQLDPRPKSWCAMLSKADMSSHAEHHQIFLPFWTIIRILRNRAKMWHLWIDWEFYRIGSIRVQIRTQMTRVFAPPVNIRVVGICFLYDDYYYRVDSVPEQQQQRQLGVNVLRKLHWINSNPRSCMKSAFSSHNLEQKRKKIADMNKE